MTCKLDIVLVLFFFWCRLYEKTDNTSEKKIEGQTEYEFEELDHSDYITSNKMRNKEYFATKK